MTTPRQYSRRTFLAQSAAALTLARTRFASAAPAALPPEYPRAIPLGSIKAGGDLAHRTAQNFARLQEDMYRPPQVFRGTNWKSWPGDMEGRALLAISLLSRASSTMPDYFPAMVAAYPAQLNPQGYFGPLLDLHAINEQQLSGHGWFLRGLCEYYEWRRDPATLAQIRAVIVNLALPLRGKYAVYPIDPALRAAAAAPSNPGAVDGHLSGQHGDWAVSSDTGCAFIFLDGLAHAWLVLKAEGAPEAAPLKALIDEAIARFLQIDLVAIKAQTHASLTAMRALLRVYAETGDAALLAAARDRYHLYRTTAMTEHYANTNWFGRPDSWTEPCAILDSFMVATQLFQFTDDAAYLEDAHPIWFNGVGRGLRANGGFGTDTCPGPHSAFVKVRSYEAYFCCTMRGGEGHARAAQYLYLTRPALLTIPFFSDSDVTFDIGRGPMRLRQTTGYPYSGNVRIEVLSALRNAGTIPVRLFAPSWTRNHALALNGAALPDSAVRDGFVAVSLPAVPGNVLNFTFDLRVGPRPPLNATTPAGYRVFMNGPLVLGYTPPANAAATLRSPDPAEIELPANASVDAKQDSLPPGALRYITPAGPVVLAPINDLNDTPVAHTDPCPRQILFREA